MHSLRLMSLTAALFLLPLGFGWAACDGLAEFGLNLWDLPRYYRVLAREGERRANLDERLSSVDGRLRLKEHLARELAAGRLSLEEAASRLREILGPEDGELWNALRRVERGGTDDERLHRHLLAMARTATGRIDQGEPPAAPEDPAAARAWTRPYRPWHRHAAHRYRPSPARAPLG